MSDTNGNGKGIAEIAKALASAQKAMGPADKGGKNPHFKSRYSTLSDVWDVAREPLSANGLSVTQLIYDDPNGVGLRTVLMHASGESIESRFVMPLQQKSPQGLGSAITYARRYALAAILGIVSDEDDDGNKAQESHRDDRSSFRGERDVSPSAPRKTDVLPFRESVQRALDEMVTNGGKADVSAAFATAGVTGKTFKSLNDDEVKRVNAALPMPFRVTF